MSIGVRTIAKTVRILERNQRADILAFGVSKNSEGKTIVHIIITECKYCKEETELKRSLEQTKNTFTRFIDILSPIEGGKQISLSIQGCFYKFSDMIMGADLSSISVSTSEFYDLLNDIRKGNAQFTLNGFSHYFCFGNSIESEITSHNVGTHEVFQQIFNKTDILELLKILAEKENAYEFILNKGERYRAAYKFVHVNTYKIGEVISSPPPAFDY